VLLDCFTETQTKYRLTPSAGGPSALNPADLEAFVAGFARGALQPFLFSQPPPNAANTHPAFPFLGVAVADTFGAVVLDPARDVALESFLSDCPMCMSLAARVRMAAYVADKFLQPQYVDEAVLAAEKRGNTALAARLRSERPALPVRVAIMNVDDNDRPRSWVPGPGFPSLQIFNGGHTVASKRYGAHCPQCSGGALATDVQQRATFAAGVSAVALRLEDEAGGAPPAAGGPFRFFPSVRDTRRGTPPCVPSLDFAHPTQPGKMALPSVKELVTWLAGNASRPFNPLELPVPLSEYKGDLGEEVSAAERAASFIPLAHLLDDMETEASVLTRCVFDLFFFDFVVQKYAAAFGLVPADPKAAPPPKGFPARSAAEKDRALRTLADFNVLVDAARKAVLDQAMYGTAMQALEACTAAERFNAEKGILQAVRDHQAAVETAEDEDKAVGLALTLAEDEAVASVSKL
jgi:hypothetical protein